MIRCRGYTFDPERRLVVAATGEVVHLTAKAFDLLLLLIRESPRVVTKPDLHRELWPDTFVSDAALTGLVKELRRALPVGNDPPLIRTAHGVGFAFEGCSWDADARQSELHCLITESRRYVLCEGINIIGRDPSCEVRLVGDDVSRRHARILIRGGQAALDDLGSKNGTVVNGMPARARLVLSDKDVLRVGSIVLTYRRQDPERTTVTQGCAVATLLELRES